MKQSYKVFWFRRDLRLHDNHGLYEALRAGAPVLPLFIFDTSITDKLQDKSDARISFIYKQLETLHKALRERQSGLLLRIGKPVDVFQTLLNQYSIAAVFANSDYEPYATERDNAVKQLLGASGVQFQTYKDQVIFEKQEVLKPDGRPYTVFTPYSRKWKALLASASVMHYPSENHLPNLLKIDQEFPVLEAIGFQHSNLKIPDAVIDQQALIAYAANRNFPWPGNTSLAGPHLRFGTISIRHLVLKAVGTSETYLNELIWREFFMQIIWHFPRVLQENFNPNYRLLAWRNNEQEFNRWCEGRTGYPLVDAGMRQLNQTGFMHNRVRMVAAGFLTKHLLIDWRWGETYFAGKLLDYELASNNGNWQWAAGTGCDAAPYFRVYNPHEQARKFDPDGQYTTYWIPELNDSVYPKPIVEHTFARSRAIHAYKQALSMLSK
ncbi:MAG: DNA photolyase family protein [Bacteroidetes bacterium]|nr:DNA photolyase family protein [Bacteroidota bacterium]